MYILPRRTVIIFTTLLFLASIKPTIAEMKFSGDMTGVSTYIWRGIKQYNGPSMQGTAGFSYGPLAFGLWCSSVALDDIEIESDPYIELSLPTGSLSSSVGVSIYTYDLFESFNDNADYEYEIFVKTGIGPVSLAAFFVPSQSSTEDSLNKSDYWIEVSGETSFKGANLGVLFGYGTNSSKSLATPKKDAVSHLILNAGKSITDNVSVNWNYSIGLDDDMENILWLGFVYGF